MLSDLLHWKTAEAGRVGVIIGEMIRITRSAEK
jgi:hypothetical protein